MYYFVIAQGTYKLKVITVLFSTVLDFGVQRLLF